MQTSLRKLSYFKTGGSCDTLAFPEKVEQLQDAVMSAKAQPAPLIVLGEGSNSLVLDEHYPGTIVKLDNFRQFEKLSSTRIKVGAGWENSELIEKLREHGLYGLEWMYRLPGQIGGTVRMNARCYGGEISQFAKVIRTVNLSGEVKEYSGESCFYGYKDTLIMREGGVVFEVELELKPEDTLGCIKMQEVEGDRVSKKQFDYPTCGCVFKNNYHPDISVSSGLLLELSGAKDLSEGGALVSPYHANFVWNRNQATSVDILRLSFEMRQRVYEYFGVWLEYEMEVLGKLDKALESQFYKQMPFDPNDIQKKRLQEARSQFAKRIARS